MLKKYFYLPKRGKKHVQGLNRIPEKVLLNYEPQSCTKEDLDFLQIIASLNKSCSFFHEAWEEVKRNVKLFNILFILFFYF